MLTVTRKKTMLLFSLIRGISVSTDDESTKQLYFYFFSYLHAEGDCTISWRKYDFAYNLLCVQGVTAIKRYLGGGNHISRFLTEWK